VVDEDQSINVIHVQKLWRRGRTPRFTSPVLSLSMLIVSILPFLFVFFHAMGVR